MKIAFWGILSDEREREREREREMFAMRAIALFTYISKEWKNEIH